MLQMCLKLSSSVQEGNLLLLLVKIRVFFALIGSAKIYEFLCILRELCKGCTLLSVSNPATVQIKTYVVLEKQISFF